MSGDGAGRSVASLSVNGRNGDESAGGLEEKEEGQRGEELTSSGQDAIEGFVECGGGSQA